MKRFLLAALLSLGAVALTSSPASAYLFKCKCYKKCCTFCCRPYNAFSPSCCGTMFCDGCCPKPCFQPQGPPAGYDGGCPDGACCADGACGGAPWAGPGYLPSAGGPAAQGPGAAGGTAPAPGGQLPMPGNQPFQPPTPMPLPNGAGVQSYYPATYLPPVQPVVSPAAYQYGYPPAYPPAGPMGYLPMNGPNYWYQQ